ncbi:glycosyltransferase family 4 protein [Fibrobacterota bacterium]
MRTVWPEWHYRQRIKAIAKKRTYRIAFLLHGDRNVGGGEYSLYHLISGLRKDVFFPVVFYAHENEIIRKLKKKKVQLVKIPLNKRITSVYRDEIRKDPVSWFFYLAYLLAGIFQVSRGLNDHNIDILHPHDNLSKIIGGFAALGSRAKTVTHCRDLLKETVIEKLLMLFQVIFIKRIIAVSEDNRQLFKIGGTIPKKVSTIHNGLDIKKFIANCQKVEKSELSVPDGDVVIGMIAVFDKCKGHIILFRAIKRLVSSGAENITCLIMGDGREKKEQEGFVAQLGLQRHVQFLGYRKDIARILSAVDIVVQPSLQESFPRAPLEAMAMKLPVIASMIGGIPESVEDGKTGLLVPPGDDAALSEAIRRLIERPEVRKQMGERGRKRVEEKFSMEENVRKTESIYFEVLQDK